MGDSFITHTIWLENSEGLTSALHPGGAEVLMGQAHIIRLRVANHCAYSLHALLGCHDLPGAPEAEAFRCEPPGVHGSNLARGFSPAPVREPYRHRAWYRRRQRALMDIASQGEGKYIFHSFLVIL